VKWACKHGEQCIKESELCRLPGVKEAKEQVDIAIQQVHSPKSEQEDMPDILLCIAVCRAKVARLQSWKNRTNESGGYHKELQELSSARRLGAHYLMRYFLLIAFRAFLQDWFDDQAAGKEEKTFSSWFEKHKEMGHLLNECTRASALKA
jgi:hypothetical protein